GFAYGTGAPTVRGVAVPRATAPIRTAGAAVSRAASSITTYRGANGTPVYTNLPRTQSRVGRAPSDVGTAPSAPASESRRAVAPDAGAARTQAVPRSGQPAPPASSRVSPSADGTPSAGTTSPRAYGRAGAIERTPSPTAAPRDDRPYGGAYRRPGGVPAEAAPAPPPTSAPERQSHQPAPRAPEASPGVRAMPRSYEAPPPPPAYRSSPGGERRAAEPARPSAPPPAAAPRAGGQQS